MICVITAGPHSHEHFKWDKPAPPKEIRMKGPSQQTIAVYSLTDYKRGHYIFGKCEVQWGDPPLLVEFIEYDE